MKPARTWCAWTLIDARAWVIRDRVIAADDQPSLRPLVAGVVCLLGLLLLSAYAFWLRRRRADIRTPAGAAPATIQPTDLSPAALAALSHGLVDVRCLGAAIVSLAEKGALVIEDEGGVLVLRPTGGGNGVPLSEDERATARLLFSEDRARVMQTGQSQYFVAAERALADVFDDRAAGYFVGNQPWVLTGVIFSALVLLAGLLITGMGFGSPVLTFFAAVVGYAWALAVRWLAKGGGRIFGLRALVPVVVAVGVPLAMVTWLPARAWLMAFAALALAWVAAKMFEELWWTRTAVGQALADAAKRQREDLVQRAAGGGLQPGDLAYALVLGAPVEAAPAWFEGGTWTNAMRVTFLARLAALMDYEDGPARLPSAAARRRLARRQRRRSSAR